jgi:restriction system protein
MNENLLSDDKIDDLLKGIAQFKSTQNYWLVRTNGGNYYQHFKQSGIIGIGYDNITVNDFIASKNSNPSKPLDYVEKLIKENYDKNRPKYIATQLNKFIFDIKRDDIVIIPSHGSNLITIGIVLENNITIVETPARPIDLPEEYFVCPFKKTKKVKWLKTIRRHKLDNNLYKLLFSHHTISEANDYSNEIHNILYDFYKVDNEISLVLNVETTDDIIARDLFGLGYKLLNEVDDIFKYYDLNLNTSDVEVKLSLNSPGTIQLTTKQAFVALVIGLSIVWTVGGGGKIKVGGAELDLHTNGIAESIIKYQDHAHNREMEKNREEFRQQIISSVLKKHTDSLQLKTPDDLVKILNANKSEFHNVTLDKDSTSTK